MLRKKQQGIYFAQCFVVLSDELQCKNFLRPSQNDMIFKNNTFSIFNLIYLSLHLLLNSFMFRNAHFKIV